MIALQIITVLFSIACAWLNKWPVVTFRYYGLSREGEKDFHAANAILKFLWAVAILNPSNSELSYLTLIQIFILFLIQWFVFDIALNLFTGKPWDYLGQTAWIDKLVKNGKVKAATVLLVIIALNFFL